MQEIATSAEEVRQAERALRVILEDIQEVQRKLKRYYDWESSRQGNAQALILFEKKDLDDKYAAVAERAEDTFAKRTKTAGALQKTKWALYKKKHFETLLNHISESIGNLEKRFPGTRGIQRELVIAEVKEIAQSNANETQNLTVLSEAIEGQSNADELLAQALHDAVKERGATHTNELTEVSEEAELEQGDQVHSGFMGGVPRGRLGHNYEHTILTGKVKGRQGDTCGSASKS
jgi:hypothetical protein